MAEDRDGRRWRTSSMRARVQMCRGGRTGARSWTGREGRWGGGREMEMQMVRTALPGGARVTAPRHHGARRAAAVHERCRCSRTGIRRTSSSHPSRSHAAPTHQARPIPPLRHPHISGDGRTGSATCTPLSEATAEAEGFSHVPEAAAAGRGPPCCCCWKKGAVRCCQRARGTFGGCVAPPASSPLRREAAARARHRDTVRRRCAARVTLSRAGDRPSARTRRRRTSASCPATPPRCVCRPGRMLAGLPCSSRELGPRARGQH